MPGVLEDIASKLLALEQSLAEVAETVRKQAHPVCPMLPDEEVWADGALTVQQAIAFLTIKQSKLFELMRSGELVSAIDGRRLIAKRGCIRYLLAHQEHVHAEIGRAN